MERKSLGKNPVPRFNGHGRPALLTSISSEPHRLLIMRRVAVSACLVMGNDAAGHICYQEWDYRGQGQTFLNTRVRKIQVSTKILLPPSGA
uniref:Uncharacterized protein n=1 Tax=Oryza meridionalis TaxID=40149 RepID=A0A0E0C7P1_9ORYZ